MYNPRAALFTVIVLAFLVLLLPGCRTTSPTSTTEVSPSQEAPVASVRTIPTLYPTATIIPTVEPTETRPPQPTEPPSTPINFEQIVVDIRYAIPAISLDRRIVGNVSSRIEVIDQTTGESVVIPDQPGIMVELQQALNEIALAELPVDCITCVNLDYSLPLGGEEGMGWLQDIQLLASLENYTSVQLGPHFPPGTVLGLRQSATPYQVAKTIALTADDQLWRWSATDDQVIPEQTDLLPTLLGELPEGQILDSLFQPERVVCPVGPGVETIYLVTEADVYIHDFTCPELTLASSLVPIYTNLVQLATEGITEPEIARPESIIPLGSVLDYEQMNGNGLSLFRDGLAVIRSIDGITRTVALTDSLVLSTTTALIESELLFPGVEGLLSEEEANVLFVRGPLGVYSLRWLEGDDQALEIVIRQLDALRERIESLLAVQEKTPVELTPTPTSSPDSG